MWEIWACEAIRMRKSSGTFELYFVKKKKKINLPQFNVWFIGEWASTRREIHYLRAPMFYSFDITILQHVTSDSVKEAALYFFFPALNLFFRFNRVIVN